MPPQMFQISVQQDQVKALIAALSGPAAHKTWEEEVTAALESIGKDTVDLAKKNLTAQGAVDTKELLNSIGYSMKVASDGISLTLYASAAHATRIEEGEDAGTFPAPGELLGWMQRHGIPENAEFAIARAIARRGFKPRPFMRPAAETMSPQIGTRLAAAQLNALKRIMP